MPTDHLAGVAPSIGGAIDHLGIIVPDIEAAIAFHCGILGLVETQRRDLPESGLRVAFLSAPEPGLSIELIAPLPGSRPLCELLGEHTAQDFLLRQPQGGLHHVCFRTRDLALARETFAAAGVTVLGDGRGAVGASGRTILFLSPASPAGVLIELKEIG